MREGIMRDEEDIKERRGRGRPRRPVDETPRHVYQLRAEMRRLSDALFKFADEMQSRNEKPEFVLAAYKEARGLVSLAIKHQSHASTTSKVTHALSLTETRMKKLVTHQPIPHMGSLPPRGSAFDVTPKGNHDES